MNSPDSQSEGGELARRCRGRCRRRVDELGVLAEQELIGHAGDVVADDSMRSFDLYLARVVWWHGVGMIDVVGEELFERGDGARAILHDGGMIVEPRA